MAWKKFNYKSQFQNGEVIYRPMIDIELANNSGSFKALALVDSGTDAILVNSEIAEALNVSRNTCAKIQMGGVGKATGFICEKLHMTVPDLKKSFEVTVTFLDELPFQVLVGQKYFFDNFHVRFEKDKNMFYLALPPKTKK